MSAYPRDTAKLADWTTFTARMRLHDTPASPHVVIGNRLTAPASPKDQIAALLEHQLEPPAT